MSFTTTLVDSLSLLQQCLADITPTTPHVLAVDIEGIDINRHGKICLLQLMCSTSSSVWLIDVTVLGAQAFEETDASGISLRTILEGSETQKLFFDVRNDSDALYNLYNISLSNVYDLQLLEVAVRLSICGRARTVSGLAKTIQFHLNPAEDWAKTKDLGVTLFAPEKGGSYEVFERRPLDARLIAYCSQDVTLLASLRDKMREGMGPQGKNWENRILAESKNRVALARSASYDGRRNRAHALAPVVW
ncbi:ribonuclease H-like domain-containing protein [Flammula alnicola]|nr:ribonuclease H-like domain-containing protein [Flammula alnicola]